MLLERRKNHIQFGYHRYYQSSARVSSVLRAPVDLVFELFLEMPKEFLEVEACHIQSAMAQHLTGLESLRRAYHLLGDVILRVLPSVGEALHACGAGPSDGLFQLGDGRQGFGGAMRMSER